MIIAIEPGARDGYPALLYLFDSLEAAADELEITIGSGIGDFIVYDDTGQLYEPIIASEKRVFWFFRSTEYKLAPVGAPDMDTLAKYVKSATLEKSFNLNITIDELRARLCK